MPNLCFDLSIDEHIILDYYGQCSTFKDMQNMFGIVFLND